jgi:hypothetical protein
MTMSSSSCLAALSAVVLDMTRQSSLRAPRYRGLSLVLPRALLAPLVVPDADNTNHADDNAFTSMRRQLLGMGAGRG